MKFRSLSAHLSAVAIAGAFIASSAASAAEVPNLVGTWKLVGDNYASVRLGAANDHQPQYDKPDVGEATEAWTLLIEEQEGRAFHGHSMSPKGKDEPIVGVISNDGKHLIMSGLKAGLQAEFVGDDQIEFCYVDHEPDRAAVACILLAKQ